MGQRFTVKSPTIAPPVPEGDSGDYIGRCKIFTDDAWMHVLVLQHKITQSSFIRISVTPIYPFLYIGGVINH